jgi:hypothetical protein
MLPLVRRHHSLSDALRIDPIILCLGSDEPDIDRNGERHPLSQASFDKIDNSRQVLLPLLWG